MFVQFFAPYTLRALRPRQAEDDADGFVATLWRSELPVAKVDTAGGPDRNEIQLDFKFESEREAFKRTAEQFMSSSLDQLKAMGHGLELQDVDDDVAFLLLLAEAMYQEQRLSAVCEQSTLFRTPSDASGAWRRVGAPYRKALGVAIKTNFPDALIANEVLFASTP